MNKVRLLLDARTDAERRGDWGVWRARNAELMRYGLADMPGTNTAVAPAPETVVPSPKRRGPRPRCEHGMIPDRCPECEQ